MRQRFVRACTRRDILIGAMLAGLVWQAGCATTPPEPEVLQNPDGHPLSAAFVLQERVHSVGRTFSLRSEYWTHIYPAAASAFAEARRYGSYSGALSSGADVIVVGRTTIYGAREGFRVSLEVVVLDANQNELLRHAYRQKEGNLDTAGAVYDGLSRQVRDLLTNSKEMRRARRPTYGVP